MITAASIEGSSKALPHQLVGGDQDPGGPGRELVEGWFDRAQAYGFAYEDGRRYETGYFSGRAGVLGMTTGGTEKRFSPEGAYGSIEQVLWPTQHCMVEYLGLATAEPFVAYAAPRVYDARRQEYLDVWSRRVLQLEELVAPALRVETSFRGSPTSWASPV